MRPQSLRSPATLALVAFALLPASLSLAAPRHKHAPKPAPPSGDAAESPDAAGGSSDDNTPANSSEMDAEMPPPEAASSAPTTAPVLYDHPNRNRWDLLGGVQGYFPASPGAIALQIEGGYGYILANHFDAVARLGIGLGSCCAHGFYFDIPATVGVRIYTKVDNDVPGMLGRTTGAKVRTMREGSVAAGSSVYLIVDTGLELSVKSTTVGGAFSGVGWIVGGGLGLEHNLSLSSAVFGEVHMQFNPTHVTYSGSDRGTLTALLVAGGYRF